VEETVEGDEVFDVAENAEFEMIGFFDEAWDTGLNKVWTRPVGGN